MPKGVPNGVQCGTQRSCAMKDRVRPMALSSGEISSEKSPSVPGSPTSTVSGPRFVPGVVRSDQALSVRDFDVLTTLGQGGFGTVLLVRKRNTGKLYALKVLEKARMKKSVDAVRAISERAAMQEISHPFVTMLHFAWQDEGAVYYCLEFVGGGDLFSHLEKSVFPEAWARVYVAEIALAIDHVHKHNFAYRDLKPENVLVDSEGHIKLADFGLAKKIAKEESIREAPDGGGVPALHNGTATEGLQAAAVGRGRLHSMIGTFAFAAPEMFDKQGYGRAVDWWALGLMLCEMITGDLPIAGDQDMDARLRAFRTNQHLRPLPKSGAGGRAPPSPGPNGRGSPLGLLRGGRRSLSPEAADLIKRFLVVNPAHRMCCGPQGLDELKEHPFFHGASPPVPAPRGSPP